MAQIVPDWHAWPTDTWALQYIPTGQGIGLKLLLAQKLPAGQGRPDDMPVALQNEPASHGDRVALPSGQINPIEQIFGYDPGPQ